MPRSRWKELGIESIMVNSNPETVSTDYDTSDYLFFEPLTIEDVLNICDRMQPDGVIVQFGGQTPLNLARGLEAAGVTIIGTSPDMIDAAEDRDRFQKILEKLGLHQPPNGIATNIEGARAAANRIGYPVLVRPSYVLGGRAMEICYDQQSLERYMTEAVDVSPDKPVLIDKFLEDAIEVDVDAISDGETTVIGGVMEHIEFRSLDFNEHSDIREDIRPRYIDPDPPAFGINLCFSESCFYFRRNIAFHDLIISFLPENERHLEEFVPW